MLQGQGQGFVKAGAWRHVTSCYVKQLASRGLQLGNWDDEKQAQILEPLGTKYVEPVRPKIETKNWPWK